MEGITLATIPASARAVYAPRENPFGKTSDCTENQVLEMNKDATEDADFITMTIIPHEEHVALDDMLGEVPREHQIKNLARPAEDGRDCAWLHVGPDPRLRSNAQLCRTSGRKWMGKYLPGNNTPAHPGYLS
jgi:hypothetical protein